jgi:hypothetical protein
MAAGARGGIQSVKAVEDMRATVARYETVYEMQALD